MAPKAEKTPAKKAVVSKVGGDKKIRKKSRDETFKMYIYKVLK